MKEIIINLSGFLLCTVLITICGTRLSRYGDMMADLLGWGKIFMGLLLMASVTSLPELMTGMSSILVVKAPNFAVGDVVGSCAFNILIISIMDLFYDKKKPLTSVAQVGHVIAASFSIIMLSFLAVAIIMPEVFGKIAFIGGFSIIFLILYFIALRVIFLFERKQIAIKKKERINLNPKQVITRYSINAVGVMIAALALPYFGEKLAGLAGVSQSFFGTLFLALSTSLPEIVVGVAAVRLGSIDLAIGNIFGSNIFNISILAFDDILFTKGPLFLFTSPSHIVPVLGTIIISAIGIIGIVYKEEIKWKLAIDTVAILFVYILVIILLYIRN